MIIKDKLYFLKSIGIEDDFTMIDLLRAYTEKEYLYKMATPDLIKSIERYSYYLIQTFFGLDSSEVFVNIDDLFTINIQFTHLSYQWPRTKTISFKDLLKEQREEKLKRILKSK